MVDHDGIHPESERSGEIELAAGVHPIQIAYFEGGGQRAISVKIKATGWNPHPSRRYLVATPDAVTKPLVPTTTKLDPSLVEQGAKLFTTAVACNVMLGVTSQHKRPEANAKPLSELRLDQGCLATSVPAGLPNYDLTNRQRQRIVDAIKATGSQLVVNAPPADEAKSVHLTMASLNCYACHARGQVGGTTSVTNASFVTTKPEMGDEGRVPTGVGWCRG